MVATQNEINKLIDLYFNQKNVLYNHLFDSYHQFIEETIPSLLSEEQNHFYENRDNENIYFHGFKCNNVRIKVPIYENNNEIKFPEDARRNHLNYFTTIVADIEQYVEKVNYLDNTKTITNIGKIEHNLAIANVPVMLKSKYCSTTIKKDLHGECKYDPGGYFIVNGQEKVVMSIEKMIDNKVLVFHKKDLNYPDGLLYTAQINSKKNAWSDNLQILHIKTRKDGVFIVNSSLQLVEVPIFVLMRAFGVETDKDIISHLTYDIEDKEMLNLLRPSITNAINENIKTKEDAMNFLIARLKKNKKFSQSDEELSKKQRILYLEKMFTHELLPHLDNDKTKKIVFLGYMTNKLLNVMLGRKKADDRDALTNKRIEPAGVLLSQIFKQYWKKQLMEIGKHFKKKNQSDETPINVINQIKPSVIEQGIKSALSKGVWGISKTKKGVSQALQRLSWLQGISHLRRILIPNIDETTLKITSIRQVNPHQYQLLCCLTEDTEILLSNGSDIKLIKDINNKDCVLSPNNKILLESPTYIYKKFNKKINKVFKITTISGRSINVTDDHKLLVSKYNNKQWVISKEIKIGDLLIVKNVHKYYPNVIIENDYNYTDINKYKPLLYIFARIYGNFYKNTYLNALNTHDAKLITIDLINLGFNRYCQKTLNNNIKISVDNTKLFLNYCNINNISEWVLNGTDLIKREFLGGYFGSFEEQIQDIVITDEQIITLLKHFDINKLTDKTNIVKFTECIGLRYNTHNNIQLGFLGEYYKICLLEQNYTTLFSEFLEECKEYNYMRVPIKSIEVINDVVVHDFTTESSNHSFIANGIVSSNCVETPEGAKIGVVKSLAMMASITINNSYQKDIINKLLSGNTKIIHPYNINPLNMKEYVKIFSDGDIYGVVKIKYALEIYEELKMHRFNKIIDKNTTIAFDYNNKEICIYYEGGRLIRPLLIVNESTIDFSKELINDINIEYNLIDKSKSWAKIYEKYKQIIEYEDIETLRYLLISENINELHNNLKNKNLKPTETKELILNRHDEYKWVMYTHCDFHPWTIMGSIAVNVPYAHHNYSARNILCFSQLKQSVSIFLSSYKTRIDNSQILYHPQLPLVITQGMKYNNCLNLPFGENVVLAILTYNGYNQDDSIMFNKSSVDRGLFRADIIRKYHSEIKKNPSTSQDDVFGKPEKDKVTGLKYGNYNKLNASGYAEEETIINNEDIIIGKLSPIHPTGNNNKIFKDNSEIFKSNSVGVVDKVYNNIINAEGYKMIDMRIRIERKPLIGDKFTCYDETHDVLTSVGWINIKDINKQHEIATLIDNKLLEYKKPKELYIYDTAKKMYQIENENVSLCVTLNHRMYVNVNNKNFEIIEAQNILNKKVQYKNTIEENNGIINNNYFIYENNTITNFKLYNETINIDTWLYVYSIFLINGSLNLKDKYIIIYTFNIDIDLLTSHLNSLNYTICIENNTIHIINDTLFNYFLENNTSEYNLSEWVLYLCKEKSKCLIDLIFDFNKNDKLLIYHKLKVNRFQHLSFHAGYYSKITFNEIYIFTLYREYINTIVNDDKIEDCIIDFSNQVYCVEVEGDGIIYVRKNGKPVWSGNSRNGQKGTIGILYEQKDMPFTESGMTPDLILNPHGFPKRMSIGLFIETIASKQAAATGRYVDGTPFNDSNLEEMFKLLKEHGYSPYGTEVMYCGITGKKMEAEIFIGPSYNVRLKHMVLDRIHARARGPKQALTRQPLEGRSKEGGLKIGVMEKDAIISHGASQFLKEKMMESSDITKVHVCDMCGMFASKVIDKDYYKCKGCKNSIKISAVVIPYACKLMFQELTSVNILPRIRTEDSVYNNDV